MRNPADAMKLALKRRANQKLVAARDDVMKLISDVASLKVATVDEVVAAWPALEAAADGLGLPVTGEDWASRLVIKAKGGGEHFDAATREAAGRAYARGAAMHSAVAWHEQLRARTAQLERCVGGQRSSSVEGQRRGSDGGMGRAQLLARASDVLAAAKKTVDDICEEGALRVATREMQRHDVPQALSGEAAALRAAAAPLASWAHGLCLHELRSLRCEKKMTQRFRAASTLAVLAAAEALILEVHALVQRAAPLAPNLLGEVREARAEVEPMCGGDCDNDELDDEI